MSGPSALLDTSDSTYSDKTKEVRMPPAATTRGAVGDIVKKENVEQNLVVN